MQRKQQKLFLSAEPKPRKDKSVTTVYTSPGGLAFSSAPSPLCTVGDAEKQGETSASGAGNSPRCLQQSPLCPRDENHQLVASIIFCLGNILFACWNHVLFFPVTDVKDCFFLIMLRALREFKEQKICQEQFTNGGYFCTRSPGLQKI